MEPIEKIRNILFEELDNFRKNDQNLQRARTISKLSAQTIYSIRTEIENKKLELELGKSDEEVKKWMAKDFTKIGNKKGK